MKRRLGLVLAVVCLLAIVLGIYLWGTPHVVNMFPTRNQKELPAGTGFQITFSREMRREMVIERLKIEPPHEGEITWQGSTLLFTPTKPWPNGETIKVSLAGGSRAAGLLSLPMNQGISWSFQIENPLVVYLYPANGLADLYTVEPISGFVQQISDVPGEVLDFSITNNGLRIYFSTNVEGEGSVIYRLDRETGENKELIECSKALCRYPQVSPNGEFLVYERTPLAQLGSALQTRVWLVVINGEDLGEPMLVAEESHQTQQPQWSPTGMLTFYDLSMKAFRIYDPTDGQTVEIASLTGRAGVWQPDGTGYLFAELLSLVSEQSAQDTGLSPIPTSHLLRFDWASRTTTDLSKLDNLEDTSPYYSPDGQAIVFARKYLNLAHWTPGRQIWMMAADGNEQRSLTNEAQYNHYDFSWSPNGNQLAYVRFNQMVLTEPPEIWIMDADGSEARLLVKGGFAPQWIP